VVISPELRAAHERATTRFTSLVASMPPEARAVPGLTWNTLEVAAHVVSVLRGYRRSAEDGVPLWRTPTEGPAENQRLLDSTPEREPSELAAAVDIEAERFRAALDAVDGVIPMFGDIVADPEIAIGVNLGDVVIHGVDLSRALARDWRIDPADAVRVARGVYTIIPGFVDPDAARRLRATIGLTLRGGPSWGFTFDNGRLRVEEGRPARADCRILAAPVGLMLASYGRQSQARTLLSGAVLAYGRKPWLATRFSRAFIAP